ncbi:hypothetical protein LXL04_010880 [Taraxacum kok-saghyz]
MERKEWCCTIACKGSDGLAWERRRAGRDRACRMVLYKKWKNVALEVEGLVKQLPSAGEHDKIDAIVNLLTYKFSWSNKTNHQSIAAITIGIEFCIFKNWQGGWDKSGSTLTRGRCVQKVVESSNPTNKKGNKCVFGSRSGEKKKFGEKHVADFTSGWQWLIAVATLKLKTRTGEGFLPYATIGLLWVKGIGDRPRVEDENRRRECVKGCGGSSQPTEMEFE